MGQVNQRPSLVDFLKGLPVWGPLAVGAALAPTLDQLVSFVLVTDYWQPGLNRSASVISGLTCVAAYALALRMTVEKRRRVLCFTLVLFVSFLLLCILIQVTDLPSYAGSPIAADLIVFANVVFYLGIFASFAMILVVSYFLMFRR